MPATETDLLTFLDQNAIPFQMNRHPPLHTVEDSKALRGDLPGGHCKNLFLKDKAGRFYLLVCDEDRRIRMRDIEKRLNTKRLSFGAPDMMETLLGVTPGAVTPFALINDQGGALHVILDQAMLSHEYLNYHPLHNQATLTIRAADLLRFLALTGHQTSILDLAPNAP